MKYTKYTLLAMSALALGTVGTKAPHLASANQSVVATDKAHTADITAAANAVSNLFANGTHTKLAAGVTAEKIAAVEKLVAKIPTSNPNYARLHNLCAKAKELLDDSNNDNNDNDDNDSNNNNDIKAATQAVNALFTDNIHTKLAAGVDRDKINEVKDMITKYLTFDNHNTMILYKLCIKALELLP